MSWSSYVGWVLLALVLDRLADWLEDCGPAHAPPEHDLAGVVGRLRLCDELVHAAELAALYGGSVLELELDDQPPPAPRVRLD